MSLDNALDNSFTIDEFVLSEYFHKNYVIYLYIVAISMSILYTMIYLFMMIEQLLYNLKDSLQHLSQLYTFMLLILVYIFLLPILELLLVPILTKEEPWDTMDSAEYVFIIIGSSITALFLLLITGITLLFFHEEQLDSNLPWSMSSLGVDYIKLFKKFLIACCAPLTFDNNLRDYLQIFIVIISWIEFLLMLFSARMDKKWPYIILIFSEVVQWIVFNACILNNLLEYVLIDYWLITLMIIPIAIILIYNIKHEEQIQLLIKHPNEIDNINTFDVYTRNLLRLADLKSSNFDYPALSGYIRNHCGNCNYESCPCRIDDFMDTSNIERANNMELAGKQKIISCIHKLCNHFIQEGLLKFGRHPRLYIMSAYIQLFLYGNRFQALYDIQQAMEISASIYESFLIYRLK